jgi:hypothetical protein
MSTYSILVTNNAPGCETEIEQQLLVTGCTTYIVRLASNSNALGPFNVFVDDVIYYSAATRNQMINGVVVSILCETPTPTPTPTNTETPTQTPTNTETPTQTPTNTVTPTVTATPGASPTQTPTNTETPTPTPTNTETPTQTPTNTETPTQTPTPSSTTVNLEILIFLQNGNQLITQDENPLILQQLVTTFEVSFGDVACNDTELTQQIYSSVSEWSDVLRFYSDIGLTTPFNGGDLYYANNMSCGSCWQIDSDGFTYNLSNQPPC